MKTKEIHLIALYTAKPRDSHMTYVKGYMKDPANIQYDERVGFTRGLKTKDQITASIILNLSKKKVVKNTYNGEQRDFDSLFKYFLEAHPQYVAQVMADLDLAYLAQFIPQEDPAVVDAEVVSELGTPNVEETAPVK
jgi:hypothetical protein